MRLTYVDFTNLETADDGNTANFGGVIKIYENERSYEFYARGSDSNSNHLWELRRILENDFSLNFYPVEKLLEEKADIECDEEYDNAKYNLFDMTNIGDYVQITSNNNVVKEVSNIDVYSQCQCQCGHKHSIKTGTYPHEKLH